MTRLANALEALADTRAPVSIHATMDEWCDRAGAHEAVSRLAGQVPSVLRTAVDLFRLPARLRGGDQGRVVDGVAHPDHSRLELWLADDGRARVERRWDDADGSRHQVTLGRVDGRPGTERCVDLTTGADVDRGAVGRPHLTSASSRFWAPEVSDIVACLDMVAGEPVDIAGRSAIAAVATARPGTRPWPHVLPAGADQWTLTLDLEHGHLLHVEGTLDGHPFERRTTTAITYGRPLASTLFTDPTPPPP